MAIDSRIDQHRSDKWRQTILMLFYECSVAGIIGWANSRGDNLERHFSRVFQVVVSKQVTARMNLGCQAWLALWHSGCLTTVSARRHREQRTEACFKPDSASHEEQSNDNSHHQTA
jgi:hypothetical protein